jgi:RNA polymerase sigma-70 factor (ECF subfamily)
MALGGLVRRGASPELAADLLGETFAVLLEVVRDERRELPANPAAWLLLTSGRLLIDVRRRGRAADSAHARLGLAPIVLQDPDIELILDAARDEELLARIRSLLPPEQAEALTARVVGEADYAAIASAQATSEAAVRQRVSRALATLRATLRSEP